MGNSIFVAGFSLPSTAIPISLLRFLDGEVIANAKVSLPDGYQLLYSNPTLSGMSGGPVLNSQGELVGIHGRTERDDQISSRSGKNISTRTNMAVPITYYQQSFRGEKIMLEEKKVITFDDYLAKANLLLKEVGKEKEVIRLVNKALKIKRSVSAYQYRGIANIKLNNYDLAIIDFKKAIELEPSASNLMPLCQLSTGS